jgi:hypothetical protein
VLLNRGVYNRSRKTARGISRPIPVEEIGSSAEPVPSSRQSKKLPPVLFSSTISSGFVENTSLLGFVSQKAPSASSQVDVERRGHVFASALSLQTLQFVHSAVELPVLVGAASFFASSKGENCG